MKAIAIPAAAAALLALAACDRLGLGGAGNAAGNDSGNASANSAGGDGKDPAENGQAQAADAGGKDPVAAGGVPAVAGGAPVLDRSFLIGRWTDDDCSAAVEFMSDGRFVAANGNEGLWHLAGDRLTLQGERTVTMQLEPIDQNVMNVVNTDGSLGRSTRC